MRYVKSVLCISHWGERMKRENIIPLRLWGANLYCGEIEVKIGYTLSVYFIVNKTCEQDFIRKTALQFLIDKHISYYFFGKYSNEWITEFEKAAELMNLKCCPPFQNIETCNELVERIQFESHLRPIVPFEMYIVYDDAELYQRIKDVLKYEKIQEF